MSTQLSASALNSMRYVAKLRPGDRLHSGAPGHVESWFLRANHPSRPLAVWIKVTILAPLRPSGAPLPPGRPQGGRTESAPAVVETWLVVFNGEANTTFAHRDTHPFGEAQLGSTLTVGSYALDLAGGTLRGSCGGASFDLRFEVQAGDVARPLSIFPFAWMLTAPFPKSKLVTPLPWLTFQGAIQTPAGAIPVDGWAGMQGHNWGKEHAPEYAWGQCVFPDSDAMVEGFTGRVRIGSMLTPRLSAMVIRRGSEEYRFDRIVDTWRQEATISPTRWTLRMRGPDGEARLRMDGTNRPMACLGYQNPDGRTSYCFNSKLADTLLEVRPTRGEPFHCASPHGGALEFLRPEPDPTIPVV